MTLNRPRMFVCAALASASLLAAGSPVLAQAAPAQAGPGAPQGPGGPGGRGGPGAQATPPGPPAPVPAAVAAPTPADVEAADRALARFIASDADARALTTKYPGLIDVRRPSGGPNTAIMPSLSNGFVTKHQANLAVAAQGDSELL